MNPEYYAVLTGDVIKSSLLSPKQLELVRSSLLETVDTVKGWHRGLVKGQPDFFRGDAWQLLLTDPAMALRVSIFLRASLLAKGIADTRIAIGLGEVDKLSLKRVSLSIGQAFILSGHALDKMTQYSNTAIEISQSSPFADWVSVVGHLCDSLIAQWTQRQAEIICSALDPKELDYEAIAQSLRPAVSKQAVAKALNGASWYVIRDAIRLFEKTLWTTVLRPDNQKRLSLLRQPKKVVSAQTTKKG